MASGDTKTEAMLNVLGNGGSGDEFRGCCNTKTQSYILDAIDRINAIQPGGSSDFNDLENRPQLNGTAMTGNTNITNFTGTDGTNAGAQGLVPAPAAADADKFLKSDGTWATAGGGGGVKVLTDADYNYPEDNPNRIALWLLPEGMYSVDNNLYVASPNTEQYRLGSSKSFVNIIESGANTSPAIKFLFVESSERSSTTDGTDLLKVYSTIESTGNRHGQALSFALHSELADIGLAFLYPWSDSDWPENSPDGIAVFKRSGQFDLRYKTKLYLTGTYAVDNFIGRVEINQFENDNNVSVFGFKATDLNHGTIYLGQTRGDGTSEFLYTVSTTTVQTSGGNSGSSSAEPDPGTSVEPEPGVIAPTVTCPFCGQQTPADSTICQFCGNDISGGAMPGPEEPGPEIPPEEPTEEPVEG